MNTNHPITKFPTLAEKIVADNPAHDLEGYLLIITNQCNLRCTYCFADGGSYQLEKRSIMDTETACRALDYLVNTSRKSVFMVVFFGGEPLMEFDRIRSIIDYWEKQYTGTKKVVFGIVTNGTLLNQRVLEYCRLKQIKMLISLDGTKESHDAERRYKNGKGTYDLITDHLASARQCLPKDNLACSCTLTRSNLQVDHLFHHISSLGFSRMDFQIETIFNGRSALKRKDMEALASCFERLFDDLAGSGNLAEFKRIDLVYKFLRGLERGKKNRYFCYTGRTRYAVTPEGDFYPCIFFASHQEFCFGNVKDGITKPEILRKFSKNTVDTKASCQNCFARYLCGGGCAFAAHLTCGSIAGVNPDLCFLYKKIAALCLEYKAITRDPRHTNLQKVLHNA